MTRTKQRLINYHTGKKDAMPKLNEVDYGEIVVRHNEETPELLIKVSESSFGVFQASGAVQTAINTAVSTAKSELNSDISDLQSDVNSLSSATKTLIDEVSAATKATYATKTELEATSGSIITAYTNAIAAAKDNVYSSATSFTTKEVNTLSTTISDVKSDLNELSGVVKSISTDIGNNYVTTGKLETTVTTLEGKISDAKDEVYSSANTYTDTQIAAAKESIKQTTDTISSHLRKLSASTVNIETTANSAIQNASIVDSATCKVSVSKVNTELKFDFRNIVIDCGEF